MRQSRLLESPAVQPISSPATPRPRLGGPRLYLLALWSARSFVHTASAIRGASTPRRSASSSRSRLITRCTPHSQATAARNMQRIRNPLGRQRAGRSRRRRRPAGSRRVPSQAIRSSSVPSPPAWGLGGGRNGTKVSNIVRCLPHARILHSINDSENSSSSPHTSQQ